MKNAIFNMLYVTLDFSLQTELQSRKKNSKTKLQQIHFYFCGAFALFHQGIVMTVIFKMLHTFLFKRTIKTSHNNQLLSLR